ncbi:transglutaminaseTgpA domain-containing protein [Streptomyces sp. NPDC046881]|uniref:transglutaminaseTgpA domain-containing protein n=1 Tax=Streptomyces sp. NPDC046881 TaxID=3155374 RepID=UPI00340A03A5
MERTGTTMKAAARTGEPVTALHYAELALATLSVAATAPAYGELFATKGHLVPLLATTASAAVLATVTALLRRRTPTTLLVAAVGFVVVAVYAVLTPTLRHGIPTLDTLDTLRTGVLRGWARILSVGLPADVSGELLMTPALVLFAAAFVAVSVTLRTRSLLGPLVAPVLSLVVALLLTAAHTGDELTLTGILLVVLLLFLLIRAARLDQVDVMAGTDSKGSVRTSAGRALFGLPVVVIVAVVGVVLAQVVPLATGQNRFDPRDVVSVPVEVEDTLTPLATLKSQLEEKKPRELFTVRVDANPLGGRLDRVRTAALDTYDGALWTSTDRFLVAGRTLAPDPGLIPTARVELHVEIKQLDHPYLPAVGRPERVTAGGIGFSADSGVLAAGPRTRKGLTYDVVGAVRPRDGGARLALPRLTPDTKRYTAVPPETPPELTRAAVEITSGVDEPYAKLVALEKRLRNSPYSLSARPGHSLDALRRLFGDEPEEAVGYAEQYAAAFVVLARSQGFPARVATGYVLRPGARKGNTYTVRSTDAYAWAEVDMAGYGWMAFDPTDPTRKPTDKPHTRKPDHAGGQTPDSSDSKANDQGQIPNLPAAADGRSARDWALVVLGVLVVLVIVLPALIALEKWRRRRRRRTGPPSRQIVGAWRNSTDRLTETGMTLPRSLTALEVAGRAELRLGDTAAPVAVLAPLVTEALFSPVEPSPEAVAQAWQADAALRAALRRKRGAAATVAALFDPRPLLVGRRQNRQSRRSLKKLQGG